MDKPISSSLKTIFIIHAIVAGLFGAALWLVPGRFLTLVGWIPDLITLPESELSIPGTTFLSAGFVRVIGAGFLALALSSFLGWRAKSWGEISILVQLEFAFCVLAAVGLGVSLVIRERDVTMFGWLFLTALVVFALAWGWAFWSNSKS